MEQNGKIKITDLLKLIFRSWWILLISIFLCTVFSYFFSKNYMTPVYKAESKMFVGREKDALANVNLIDLQIGEQLVTDYSELIKTNRVLEEVIENMSLDIDSEALVEMIEVKSIEKSRFLNVIVRHTDPKFATDFVNEISEVLREKAEEIVGAKNIQIVDYAVVPTVPDSPRPVRNSAIGFIVGLVIAILIVIIRFLIDNKIETREDIEELCDLSLLGEVPKIETSREESLFINSYYDLNVAESYRMIRAKLHYLNYENDKGVFLFTSALGGEGKTTTVANVAAAFALTDNKVLLIDCDMRKPQVYDIFGIDGNLGITNYISDDYSLLEITQKTKKIDNLSIICAGPMPPNPAEVIASKKFSKMIEEAKKEYDIIFIDSPPILLASDGLNMVDLIDRVVLITASRQSKKQDFIRVKEAVSQVGYDISGVIITKTQIKRNKYYQ